MAVDTKSQADERRKVERSYELISPFEFKNELMQLAQTPDKKTMRTMLNAGRGNPNWIAATPREAFFALGQFAVQESRLVWNHHDLAGKPRQNGIGERLELFFSNNSTLAGVALLRHVVDYGITSCGFDEDEWVFELVDGIIGDNYPLPDRMLVRIEQVVHDYLVQELCAQQPPTGKFDLFAVEGATAAMCYIFDTLQENYLLNRGDKVAIMIPIFPPYVEIPHLAKYNFDVVQIKASDLDAEDNHTWQYPASEIDKLQDKSIKALFLVNPSNPPSVAMDKNSVEQLVQVVKQKNPNLMIITDDVYGTFVDDYRSLMTDLPFNTIGAYSFSKYFGVTGWRLGVVAVHENNVYDHLLQQLPQSKIEVLNARYASLTQHPQQLHFIDRMVADSRQVALNHTAGLSTPQQVQMALFSIFSLLDKNNQYKQLTKDICRNRMKLLYDSLDLPQPNLAHSSYYYTQFDLADWATKHYGQDLSDFLQQHYEPVDILFRLAEKSSIVLLNGGGFYAPPWSIRVSLANLDDDAYTQIGQELRKTLDAYVTEWNESKHHN